MAMEVVPIKSGIKSTAELRNLGYYAVDMTKASKVGRVIPIILYAIVIFWDTVFQLQTPYIHRLSVPWIRFLARSLIWNLYLNAAVYVWALVVTVVYWGSELFSTLGAHPNLSEIIPFVG